MEEEAYCAAPDHSLMVDISSSSDIDHAGPSTYLDHQPVPSHDETDLGRWSRKQSRRRRYYPSSHAPPSLLSPPPSLIPYTPRKRRPPRKPGPLLLALLPLAQAAPPPYHNYQPTSTHHDASPTSVYGNYHEETSTLSYTPTGLPTSVQQVQETALPLILTRDASGEWHKSDQGWKLYGRAASDSVGHNEVVANGTDFAIEATLPKGWGAPNVRTSYYRVPLIAAASLILAAFIVVAIIMLALNRRKAQRRAKRRAERARRKALAAAGISDEQSSTGFDSVLRTQLEQIDNQYGIRKRRKKQSTFVQTKVRKWRNGLRRRKSGKGDDDDEDGGDDNHATQEIIYEEPKPIEPVDAPTHQILSASGRSGSTTSASDSVAHSSHTSPTTTQSSAESNQHTDHHAPRPAEPQLEYPNEPPPQFFLPAYRPASVRSYNMHDASGSSAPSRSRSPPGLDADGDEQASRMPRGTDKVGAPGYYPAPTTPESEAALAAVQRSEGKTALPRPSSPLAFEREQQSSSMAHVATDDKRVLERMRLGGSAPSAPAMEGVTEAGPSAPVVEVDAEGFEAVDLAQDVGSSSASKPSRPVPGHLPEPPRPVRHSLIPENPLARHDSLHLLPSAPPATAGEDDSMGPSAPPMEEEESVPPSAPPINLNNDDEDLYEEASLPP
ncbi:hypothetical protein BD324DRAFT_609014 [Kockovaella imperatae]|uniref:Uncharacterized protein n=1 Tax=Kockovaella imperatae TaxID=4999 RepID=A0A1Y1UE73_9TREE|nr:hypothetical protein BD324DRAFT_609014 [Kockovaella imperatae]ORX36343.1 hypothetical protein BD324DRAFT_609014 [Kockovaella imperatae]